MFPRWHARPGVPPAKPRMHVLRFGMAAHCSLPAEVGWAKEAAASQGVILVAASDEGAHEGDLKPRSWWSAGRPQRAPAMRLAPATCSAGAPR